MSLLIDDTKFINIKYHYIETPGVYISRFKFLSTKEEYEKNKDNPNLKELNTGWKVPTWADHNRMYTECLKYTTNESGISVTNLDFIRFRDMKLKTCLKMWDIKDEEGRPIPVTPVKIDLLPPEVANELLSGFEKITEITPQELKN
jgi:hypothetical protein